MRLPTCVTQLIALTLSLGILLPPTVVYAQFPQSGQQSSSPNIQTPSNYIPDPSHFPSGFDSKMAQMIQESLQRINENARDTNSGIAAEVKKYVDKYWDPNKVFEMDIGNFKYPIVGGFKDHPWTTTMGLRDPGDSVMDWLSDSLTGTGLANMDFETLKECFEPKMVKPMCEYCWPPIVYPEKNDCPYQPHFNQGYVWEYWWPENVIEVNNWGISAMNPILAGRMDLLPQILSQASDMELSLPLTVYLMTHGISGGQMPEGLRQDSVRASTQVSGLQAGEQIESEEVHAWWSYINYATSKQRSLGDAGECGLNWIPIYMNICIPWPFWYNGYVKGNPKCFFDALPPDPGINTINGWTEAFIGNHTGVQSPSFGGMGGGMGGGGAGNGTGGGAGTGAGTTPTGRFAQATEAGGLQPTYPWIRSARDYGFDGSATGTAGPITGTVGGSGSAGWNGVGGNINASVGVNWGNWGNWGGNWGQGINGYAQNLSSYTQTMNGWMNNLNLGVNIPFNTVVKPFAKVLGFNSYWRIPDMGAFVNPDLYKISVPGSQYQSKSCAAWRAGHWKDFSDLKNFGISAITDNDDPLRKICLRGFERYPLDGVNMGHFRPVSGAAALALKAAETLGQLGKEKADCTPQKYGMNMFTYNKKEQEDPNSTTGKSYESIDKLQIVYPYPKGEKYKSSKCFRANQIDDRDVTLFPPDLEKPDTFGSIRFIHWNKRTICSCQYRGIVSSCEKDQGMDPLFIWGTSPQASQSGGSNMPNYGWGCQNYPKNNQRQARGDLLEDEIRGSSGSTAFPISLKMSSSGGGGGMGGMGGMGGGGGGGGGGMGGMGGMGGGGSNSAMNYAAEFDFAQPASQTIQYWFMPPSSSGGASGGGGSGNNSSFAGMFGGGGGSGGGGGGGSSFSGILSGGGGWSSNYGASGFGGGGGSGSSGAGFSGSSNGSGYSGLAKEGDSGGFGGFSGMGQGGGGSGTSAAGSGGTGGSGSGGGDQSCKMSSGQSQSSESSGSGTQSTDGSSGSNSPSLDSGSDSGSGGFTGNSDGGGFSGFVGN